MRGGTQPSGALIEMLRQTGELDDILSGRGPRYERTPDPPAPPPAPTFFIPRPDWDAEARERQAAEQEQQRQEREQILAEELRRLADDGEPPETRPSRKLRRRWGT